MGRKERVEAYRQQMMDTEQICLSCSDEFLRRSPIISLTEYPIWEILECPKCGTKHFLLYDKVLCTEKDFNERIGKNYG